MSQPIIEVRNLSKVYRLGEIGMTSLREEAERKLGRLRRFGGKDVNAIEEVEKEGEFWALRDISFDVQLGEVLGIIGKNGAGKSTLLKILSRITEPSCGEIRLRGRVAALLEVGTGFHPELTGRENIYLNGTILGMKKREIDLKLDEIIAFSGVEKHIDTPVKRYSSGMNVRLGFAVAAHLEPEILIVDEVLAVGDAEFQKKCMGKMQDVAGQGRTVLFVSHNMSSVVSLCQRTLMLDKGEMAFDGETKLTVEKYFDNGPANDGGTLELNKNREGSGSIRLTKIWMSNSKREIVSSFETAEEVSIYARYSFRNSWKAHSLGIGLYSEDGAAISHLNTNLEQNLRFLEENPVTAKCSFKLPALHPGSYYLNLSLKDEDGKHADRVQRAYRFEVLPTDFFGGGHLPQAKTSPVLIQHRWCFPSN